MEAKRERYTPNDVGPSPREWITPTLSEVSILITNGFVGTATPHYTDESGIPYLYGTNVRANRLDTSGTRYITGEFHKAQIKTELKAGDLLTVQSGHIGETAVVPDELDGANCHALIVTRLKKDKVYPQFLSYYINSEIGRARMTGLEVGSTILHINTKDLKKFRILLPPLCEQRKIAQILSTWDKAISTTEQLLINSQQQKKALMQQLLTGKKRLLDKNAVRFSREWKTVEIGKMLSESRVPSQNNDASKRLTVRLNLKGIEQREHRGTEAVNSTAHFIRSTGQFIYGKQNIHKGAFGIIPSELDGYETSQDLPAFDFTGICDPIWFFYYMSQDYFYSGLETKMSGTGSKRLNQKVFFKVNISTPDIDEQRKIVEVISVADQEVTALKKNLCLLKKEKSSLMQQLLTGKIRVN